MNEINKELTVDDLFIDNRNIYTHIIYQYEDPGLHHHSFIEFFYVLDGQCIHFINNENIKISAGDAYLLTPNDTHRFFKIDANFLHRDIIFKEEYFKSFCNLYAPDFYEKLTNDSLIKHFKLTNQQIDHLEMLMQQINQNENVDLIAANTCSFIINTLIDANLKETANSYPVWISRLISLLSSPENFKTPIKSLTGRFPYRIEYICRTFKKIVGQTITNYFNEQKMKYAYYLLQSSNYSIEEICNRINFNNISHFYRLFKKTFNITPKKVSSFNN